MKLMITKQAKNKLSMLNDQNQPYLRLFYDTDDCGCGVNGLPTIRFANHKEELDKEVDCASFDVIVNRQQAIFFAASLTLSYETTGFRLSSPEGILNPIISEQSVQEVVEA
ncbi:iron-sulfur cluster biosynthesis family protein [Paraliobacillus ryukyuensis]|uniref:iron-sulfur cluster biosynthesis family protein n=1 Tax=Paraliobacillus ryukyuensis TaxID=200904 RepID=UPI0009A77C42|nr:iron-sulfur cluster biosynthesis family protein [Paraliobacillus ryukyuensis]